ncbi:hypothetical protein H9X96_04410 [Pedobacter sp. N36a]|uniref:XAC2610-related protein n=1 Tax=Pedobacter sp. N36a TaxID=2767996 RepID=UPI001656AEB6|nr:hypothetical protein [Pedobacter sp. N36a]MBC8985014.1 hypothetical protein [Pedobacter sp. N36a]
MKRALIVIFLMLSLTSLYAQPFTFKSIGLAKPFRFQVYYGAMGKGAFVQYVGQKGIIPLRIKSRSVDSTERKSRQPDMTTYVWDEVIDGQVTGSYGLVEGLRNLDHIWYVRKKDGKRFSMEYLRQKTGEYDGENKYLLHGALISFNYMNHDRLSIAYPDGQKKVFKLPDFDSPNYVRNSYIADYNFDGYDDLAFSIPDAGMGVYRTFIIYLYQPATKRFEKLIDPNDSRAKCAGLNNISIDKQKKLLYSSCRGGARWWRDTYHFGAGNKLVWVRSTAVGE